MDEKRRVRISKFMSLVLRHEPHTAGLTLEPGGWVLIDDLLAGAARAGSRFTRDELLAVVSTCEKQRFALDDSSMKVRANQGHSTEVDLQFEASEPPAELFHGTTERNLPAILRDGLVKMARHHVHLSPDTATATKVGARHGKPVVLLADAARMRADGHTFFRSANGVWLVDHVPPQYLRVV
ncbi:MAG: RNA 2'-phosphotransferase [Planctomycetes bacterium]|nr:RNA 2'-phosphotransferase [Planctomycetota bacterium]